MKVTVDSMMKNFDPGNSEGFDPDPDSDSDGGSDYDFHHIDRFFRTSFVQLAFDGICDKDVRKNRSIGWKS